MKKIVALVLSLVMVLGLATVAFGATTYQVDVKFAAGMTAGNTNVTATVADDAKAAYVDPTTGMWVAGKVPYYTGSDSKAYIPCDVDTKDAQIWYYTGTKSVFATVAQGNPAYEAVATEFTDFGTACGQLNNVGDAAGTKYYTYTDIKGTHIYQGTTADTDQVLVDGKLVGINKAAGDFAAKLNAHKWVVEKNAKNEVVAAKCSLCAVEATWVRNLASIPTTGVDYEAFAGGGYLYWNLAPVATTPSTDKVESAQTFDAGIAMYVGMSVMAAAGSAVVLKKKD